MANTWNQSGTTWNTGRWGTTEAFAVGWGARAWNDGEWGELKDETVSLTGQSITSSVGSVDAFPEQGWGSDTWNFESWGFSGLTVELDGQSITSNLGANGWSNASYGDNGWGMFTLNPADAVGLTGQQITSAVPSQFDIPEQIQGLSITSSVGSILPDEMLVGLSGQSGTLSVGSIAPTEMLVGLPGQEITSSLAGFGTSTGFGIQAYSDVDTGSNISYSDVATGTNITYKDVA